MERMEDVEGVVRGRARMYKHFKELDHEPHLNKKRWIVVHVMTMFVMLSVALLGGVTVGWFLGYMR